MIDRHVGNPNGPLRNDDPRALCSDCPPPGYSNKTRCLPCPRRGWQERAVSLLLKASVNDIESNFPDADAADYAKDDNSAKAYEQGHHDGYMLGYKEGFLRGVKERS